MCLITDIKTEFIAEEDMTVYKMLRETENPSIVSSIFQSFYYDLDRLYTTEIKKSKDFCPYDEKDVEYLKSKYSFDWTLSINELMSIGQGFHSALDKKRFMDDSHPVFECTIPKGSIFYKNATGLIVSNQIIIKCLAN